MPNAGSTQSTASVWLQKLIGPPVLLTLPSASESMPSGSPPVGAQPSQ